MKRVETMGQREPYPKSSWMQTCMKDPIFAFPPLALFSRRPLYVDVIDDLSLNEEEDQAKSRRFSRIFLY